MDNDDLLSLEALPISQGQVPRRRAFRVTTRGEIDIATAARLHDLLTGLIDRGAHLVVLDTEGIEPGSNPSSADVLSSARRRRRQSL